LWDQLSKYSSSHGWIALDARDPNTAMLHSDVRGPMRTLLKDQPIYEQLNRAAAEHFAKRAADESERWLEFKSVELYHRVQLGTGDLVRITRDAFEERPMPRDASLRLELARQILKREGDVSNAPDAVKAWASYEEADDLAIIGGFRYLPFGERRSEMRASLKTASEFAEKAGCKLPSLVFTWRECLESTAPRWRLAVMEYVLTRSGEEKARYWLLLLDMFGQSIVPRWIIFVLSILPEFRARVESSRIPRWVLPERYAASLIRKGNHLRAASVLSDTLLEIEDASEQNRMRKRLIRSQIDSLELKAAEKEISQYGSDPEKSAERAVWRSEVHLLRRDSWSALNSCEELPRDYRYYLIRARAFGQLLRISESQDALSMSRQLCEDPVLRDQILVAEMECRLFEADMETQPLTRMTLDPVSSSQSRIELELIRAYQ